MCKIPYFLHISEFLDGFHNTFPSMRELGNVYLFTVTYKCGSLCAYGIGTHHRISQYRKRPGDNDEWSNDATIFSICNDAAVLPSSE